MTDWSVDISEPVRYVCKWAVNSTWHDQHFTWSVLLLLVIRECRCQCRCLSCYLIVFAIHRCRISWSWVIWVKMSFLPSQGLSSLFFLWLFKTSLQEALHKGNLYSSEAFTLNVKASQILAVSDGACVDPAKWHPSEDSDCSTSLQATV